MTNKSQRVLSSSEENYRRLTKSRRVAAIFEKLRRRGCPERNLDILLGHIAQVPRDWREENEPWAQTAQRRAKLAKKLRNLADEIAADHDLGEISFGIHKTQLNGTPEPGMITLADLLRQEACHLEPGDSPRIRMADGALLTATEYERHNSPPRKVALRSCALRNIFELMQAWTNLEKDKRARAPNRDVEIIASVLLGEAIAPGTLTQLRKKERRRYDREK